MNESQESPQLDDAKIKLEVLRKLGNPKGVKKVIVHKVNTRSARVNVWGVSSIIHSEFYKI